MFKALHKAINFDVSSVAFKTCGGASPVETPFECAKIALTFDRDRTIRAIFGCNCDIAFLTRLPI